MSRPQWARRDVEPDLNQDCFQVFADDAVRVFVDAAARTVSPWNSNSSGTPRGVRQQGPKIFET